MANLNWKTKKPDYTGEVINIEGTWNPQEQAKQDYEAAVEVIANEPEVKHDETSAFLQADTMNLMNPSMMDLVRGRPAETSDYLIAAGIPSLVGLAAGNPDIGYSEGAKNIDRIIAGEQQGQKNLFDMWKTQQVLKSKVKPPTPSKPSLKVSDEGKPYNYIDGQIYDLNGNWVDPDTVKFGNTLQKIEGSAAIRNKFSKERENRQTMQKALEGYNKELGKIRPTMLEMETARDSLGTGELQNKVAVMSIVKRLEGRMTDDDRRFYLDRNQAWQRWKEWLNRQGTGAFSPQLIAESKALLEASVNEMDRLVEQRAMDYSVVGRKGSIQELARGGQKFPVTVRTDDGEMFVINDAETLQEALADGAEIQ